MAYATPTTPAEFAALIALIEWPEDCNQQSHAMQVILEVLSALKLGWAALSPIRLYIVSDTVPGLADWESEWVNMGYELPIPETANIIGIWETKTLATKDTAQYVWIEDDMKPTLARWWNGSSEFFLTTPSMYSNSSFTTTYQTRITQPLVLQRLAWIKSEYGHGIVNDALTYQWRSSLDGAFDIRGVLESDASVITEFRPTLIRFFSPTQISSSTLTFLFKVASGGPASINFVNAAQTRKVESGYVNFPNLYGFLGEISALCTEAIYLD